MAAGYALSVAAAVRLVTEPFRPALGAGPTPWYVAGILAGAGWLFFSGRRALNSTSEDSRPTPGE
jgi:hypothetical protein